MPGFIEIEARYLSFNQPDENGGPVRTEQTSRVASAVSVDSGRSEVAGKASNRRAQRSLESNAAIHQPHPWRPICARAELRVRERGRDTR